MLNFVAGQVDASGQFCIPQRLYGREDEVQQIMDAYETVTRGTKAAVFLSGYSGIGTQVSFLPITHFFTFSLFLYFV